VPLQALAGNAAVQRLIEARSTLAPLQRNGDEKPTAPVRPFKTPDLGRSRERRHAFIAKARKEAGELNVRKARVKVAEQPKYRFTVATEDTRQDHEIFVGTESGRPRLMISSYPMPIGAFILELRARFTKLDEVAQKPIKKLRNLVKSRAEFLARADVADAELGAANAVFAAAGSSTDDKLGAERALALKLHEVITRLYAFAKRLGEHLARPESAAPQELLAEISHPQSGVVDTGYYTRAMGRAAERYGVEGQVAPYEELPDYRESDFERDHQPHNDLIEAVSEVPEFAGKKIELVAAGRTQKGWAIMLQHTRHALGRTYGDKGAGVTQHFKDALEAKRAELGIGATPAAIRLFCIEYLVQSMKDDVAAMKAVVASDGSFGDMSLMDAPTRAHYRAEVRKQVIAGEDRILSTEASVRTYDQ